MSDCPLSAISLLDLLHPLGNAERSADLIVVLCGFIEQAQ
jgi:hypothetical protein